MTLTNAAGLSSSEQVVTGPFQQGTRTVTLDNVEDVGTPSLLRLRKPGGDLWRWSRITVARNGALPSTFLAGASDAVGGSDTTPLMQVCAEPSAPAGFTLDCWGGTVVGSAFGCQLGCTTGNILLRGISTQVMCNEQGQFPILASLSASLFCRPASPVDYTVNVDVIDPITDGGVFLTLFGLQGTSSEVSLGLLPAGQSTMTVNIENVGDVAFIAVRSNASTPFKAGNIRVGASTFILGSVVPLGGGSLVGEVRTARAAARALEST